MKPVIKGLDRQRAGELAEALDELVLEAPINLLTYQQWMLIRDLQTALWDAERCSKTIPPMNSSPKATF